MLLAREQFLGFGYGVRFGRNKLSLHGEVVGRVVIGEMIDDARIRLGERKFGRDYLSWR